MYICHALRVEVRLGEWNYKSETDCVIDTSGMFCSPHYTKMKPQQLFIRPEYNANTSNNNIGIIRLQDAIDFRSHFGKHLHKGIF